MDFKLAQFEGPLDLLLHLVSKAKISLEQIFVSEVTEQYLAYMEQLGSLDMEKTSEFLSMASTLLYIKSRSLLPKNNAFVQEEETDPEQELIEKLRIYKAYKDQCPALRELEAQAEDTFYKYPEELPELISPVKWEDTEVQLLMEAYLHVLREKKRNQPVYTSVAVHRDTYSVRVQTKKILGLLHRKKEVHFAELFEEHREPLEIAVTFLALLQLWHLRKLRIRQAKPFADIVFAEMSEVAGYDRSAN